MMDASYLQSELEAAYGGTHGILPYMFVFSGIALPATLWTLYTWEARMETAGFVNKPSFPLVYFQIAVFVVVMLTSAYSKLVMPPTMPRINSRPLKIFAATVTVTMVLVWVGFASFFVDMCPGHAAVPILAPQVDAVASYNRGYCEAWCRTDPAGFSALSRGDCGSPEKTIFDRFVSTDDVREWCQAAISTQDFSLGAPHNGVSPSQLSREKTDASWTTSSRFRWHLSTYWPHFSSTTSAPSTGKLLSSKTTQLSKTPSTPSKQTGRVDTIFASNTN